mgnify:CR=1 FL=1|tara:strand:- start:6 stop:365 length:360 start_codon:yes stop_codon:yes gene_type:complete
MNFLRTSTFIALLAGATLVNAACDTPAVPSAPDGSTATLDEMIAGQQAVKAFQAEAQEYRICLDEEMLISKAAAGEGDSEAKEDYKAQTDAYNASVSAEESVAGAFNSAIGAYKAANPK